MRFEKLENYKKSIIDLSDRELARELVSIVEEFNVLLEVLRDTKLIYFVQAIQDCPDGDIVKLKTSATVPAEHIKAGH